ncbi:MAG: beta strand repeat-containing protein, partial [Microcystaceae cyanobacterium]
AGSIYDDSIGIDNGVFNNSGTLNKNGSGYAFIDVDFNNTGTVLVEAGTLSFGDSFTQNSGILSLRGGDVTTTNNIIFNGGSFGGYGSFTGNIDSSAVLDIGYFNNTEYGQLIIDGDYTETNSANIDIQIGGYTSGTEFDFLDITGVANFDGTVNINLLDGFVPILGDTFEIINFGSYTGALDFTNLSINNNLQFEVEYSEAQITLVVEEATNMNLKPDAINDNATVESGQTVTINVLANDSDPDLGDIISIEDTFPLNTANGGIVTLNNNSTPNDPTDNTLVYTAPSNFIGDDTFVYTITDGNLTDTATVTVSVTGATSVDLPPIVANHIMPVFAQENATDTILDLSNVFTDPDHDDSGISVNVFSNSNPSLVNASVDGNNLTLDYQPNQFGFSFIILEATSNGKSVTEAFGVIVNEGVDVAPPSANNDTAEAKSSEVITLDVLANDTGNGIRLNNSFPFTTPLGGTVTLNDNNTPNDGSDDTLTYTAPIGATGNDTFTYSIIDSNNNTDTATVTIAVNIGEGTAGDDYLICTDNDDIIRGLGGNDTLEGLGGNDSYDGGEGDDTFVISGGGIDTIQDSSGNDTLDASNASSGSYIDLTPGGSNTSIDGGTVILGATLNNNTDIVFVVDISGSTDDPFAGTSVGDLNSDGNGNQVIDAEIDGGIVINQLLIAQGLGNLADIAIVYFDSDANQLGSIVKPLTDSNNNGTPDVEDSLRSLLPNGITNYEAALQQAAQIFTSLGTAPGDGNLIFLSDGKPNPSSQVFTDEVSVLENLGVNLYAFGIGGNASLADLQLIDPNTLLVTSTDQLRTFFEGRFGTPVLIENAIGTAFDDTIIGNDANNTLTGNGGSDRIEGGLGDDTYVLDALNAGGSQIEDSDGIDTLTLLNGMLTLATPATGMIGLQRNNTDLIIDLSQDGIINVNDDLVILNFFDVSGNQPGSGFIETVDNLSGEEILNADLEPNPTPSSPKLHTEVLTNVSSEWQTITLPYSYNSMVVVATPNYDSSDLPAVVRIRQAQGNQLEIKVQNPSDTPLSGYDIHLLVLEEGAYTEAEHGFTLEAGRFNSTLTDGKEIGWNGQSITPQNNYQNPVVVGSVMTENDQDWSSFWSRGDVATNPADGNNIYLGKHIASDTDTTRNNETLGYVIFESGTGTIDGQKFSAQLGSDTILGVDNPESQYDLPNLDFTPQVALVSQSAMDGGDGGWAILAGDNPINSTSLKLRIDEDQIVDSERQHTTEQVSYLLFEQKTPTSSPKLHTEVLTNVSSDWQTITLPYSYDSMVVVATPNYNSSNLPAVVRIRQAQGNQLEIKVQNPSDTALSGYDIHLLVLEEGAYTEAEHGFTLEAGRFNSTLTDGQEIGWNGQSITPQNNYQNPVVVGSVMTENDQDWSTFWSRGDVFKNPADGNNIYLGKHIGSDPDSTRNNETLGYVIFESGTGTIEGQKFSAQLGSDTIVGVDNSESQYDLPNIDFTPQVALVSQSAMDGTDGGWAILAGNNPINSNRIKLQIDEDQTQDIERQHTDEQVSYLLFEETTQTSNSLSINPQDLNDDLLTGTSGMDYFRFDDLSTTYTVTDFNPSQEDKIEIDTSVYGLGTGDFSQISLNDANHLLSYNGYDLATLENITNAEFNADHDVLFI